MAALADLVVDLSVNTAALKSGLEGATSMLKAFGSGISSIQKQISEFGELKGVEIGKELVEGLAEFVQKGAEAAEQAGKLAQAAGVPVETFSRLSYAANLSNVSAEDFAKSLEKLDKNLGAAGAGAVKQTALFQALGIAVKDSSGGVRGVEDVLGDLADKFSGMQDGASKTALAMEVFGKSGAQLIPFLNEGRDGLSELEAEADRLGITISGKTSAAATEFEDNLKRLRAAGQAVAAQTAGQLAPALTELTKELLGSKDGADALKEASTVLAGALRVLVSAGVIVAAAFEAAGTAIGRAASIVADALEGKWSQAIGEALTFNRDVMGDIGDAGAKAAQRLQTVWGDGANGVQLATQKSSSAVKTSADSILANFQRLEKAPELFKKGMEALQKVLDDYGKQAAELASGGKDPLAEIQYRLDKGDLAKDLANVGDQATVMRQKILDAAAALEKLKIGNLKIQLNFEEKLASNKLDFDVGQRTQNFNNIGSGQGSIWGQQTQGFQDFNDAITKYAAAVREKAQWEEQAKIATAKGDVEAAEGAQEFAQQAQFAADKANIAATAFEQMKSAGSTFVDGLKVLASSFTSKLGDLGKTIDDAIKGFQQGGIWGALAALVMDLLSMMDGWKTIQNIAQGALMKALQDMSKGLNSIISALQPVMGAIESIASAVHSVLGPILQLIGTILKGIAPLLTALGVSLQVIGSTLGPLIQIIGGILDPLFKVLGVTLEPLVLVFMALKVGADYVALGFNLLVDWVDKLTGHNNEGGVTDATNQLVADQVQLSQFVSDMQKDPWGAINDFNQQAADGLNTLGEQANKTSTALSKFGQQLSDVPDGFKLGLRTYQAIEPRGGGSGSPLGSFSRASISIDKLQVVANSVTDLYNELVKVHKKHSFNNGGG